MNAEEKSHRTANLVVGVGLTLIVGSAALAMHFNATPDQPTTAQPHAAVTPEAAPIAQQPFIDHWVVRKLEQEPPIDIAELSVAAYGP